MQPRFVLPPALLYTIAALGALAILFAIGWGLWVRGVEFASWVSGITGTLVAVAAFVLGLVQRPAKEGSTSPGSSQSQDEGASPGNDSGKTSPPGGGDTITAGRNAYKDSRVSHNSAVTVLGMVATVGIVAIVLAIFVFPESADGAVCERPESRTGEELQTRMFQVAYTEGHGFLARCGPGSQFAVSHAQDLFDGQHVSIVCQNPDGPLVPDPANQAFPEDYPRESTVWYLLIDGRWISALYVNTPKGEEEVAPEDEIIDCDPDVVYETTPA